MKLNHKVFKPKAYAQPSATFCPITPSGEHAWQEVVGIEGPPIENPPTSICVACGRPQ